LGRRWVTVAQALLGGLLVLVACVLPFAAERVDEVSQGTAWVLAGLIGATGVATLAGAVRARPLAAVIAPAAGLALVYLFVATAVYPAFEPRKSARLLAERLAQVTAESRAQGLPVVAYSLGNLPEPLAFYSNGLYTVETDDPEVLTRHLERPEPVWAVVDGDRLEAIPRELQRRWVVVEETYLARQPVLLLTNRDHPEGRPLLDDAPPGPM
jgi:hypothetical protein